MKRALVLASGLALALAGAAAAQIRTGNVYGSVTDSSGAVMSGVTVTISGDLGRRSTTSDGWGEFRFLTLDVGRHEVTLSLAGFKTVTREIVVATGDEIELAFVMPIATVEETVTVEAESPLVSAKKRGTSTTLTTAELDNVPNPRDPWGVLKSVPGVLLDRVNIAGNYNGQQAAFSAKGSVETTWSLDGLNITDLSSTGSSSYFDFGAFQEINVTTGGVDIQTQTGGAGINLVTRRGTNRFHGSARYLLSHDSLQRSNLPAELKGDARLQDPDGSFRDNADHIQQIGDYGFELGGPILKDKLWFYGTWGKQDIRIVRLEGAPDRTLITGYNAKLNWQATPRTMVSAFYFNSVKEKYGRTSGWTGLQEADSFLWNQANIYEKGGLPGGLWKIEVDETFSPNLFVTASAAYFDNGFGLLPRGGPNQSYTLDYDKGVAYGSNAAYTAVRPQKHLNVDGHYFFAGLGGRHELKFGFGYRDYVTTSTSHFNGNQLAGIVNSPTDRLTQVWRDYGVKYEGKYYGVYAGDVYTRDRFSVNAGLRWDVQRARNLPYTTPANGSFPNLLPAVDYRGDASDIIRWSEPSPRVGLSWALDESRQTVLRASYARYAQQLYLSYVNYENPGLSSFLAYGWTDRNGDGFVQPDEVLLDQYLYNYNVDPANPAASTTANRIDRNLEPTRDQEVVVGLDRELAGGLAVGVAYTWRRTDDWQYYPWLAGPCAGEPTVATCPLVGAGDYTANAPATANGFTAFTYSPDPALVAAGGGGRLLTNKPAYHTTFNGLELTLLKRLSNRWMGRVAFSWNDWVDRFDGSVPKVNYWGNPTPIEWDPLVDGGQVTWLAGGGSGKGSFSCNVRWQLYANGLLQLPWKLDLSGALFARQGGAYPKSLRLRAGADGTLPALAQDRVDRDRYDDVWELDLRLAKNVDVRGVRLTLSAEWFNAFNAGTVLARYRWPNGEAFTSPDPTKGRIEQVINPSILRLGATLGF